MNEVEEFWAFCKTRCTEFRKGCGLTCERRKKLGLPPFGKPYRFRDERK